MRQKTTKLVIAFPSITAVMALDAIYTKEMGSGKIIPLPPEISLGCGLAWLDLPSSEDYLCKLMEENSIPYSTISHIQMY